MNIEDIDRVMALRNYREKTKELRSQASSRTIECILGGPGGTNVFSIIEATPIRAAIITTCNDEIRKYEAELTSLGVTFESQVIGGIPSVDPRAED